MERLVKTYPLLTGQLLSFIIATSSSLNSHIAVLISGQQVRDTGDDRDYVDDMVTQNLVTRVLEEEVEGLEGKDGEMNRGIVLPPALQTLPLYLLLFLTFKLLKRKAPKSGKHDTNRPAFFEASGLYQEQSRGIMTPDSFSSASSTSSLLPELMVPSVSRWFFLIVGLCDVEANVLVVSSFKYGELQTLILLQSSTVLFVVVLSYLFLKRRYQRRQLLMLAIALVGFVLTVLGENNDEPENDSTMSDTTAIGNFLILGGSCLYAASNVFQEWFNQSHPTKRPLPFLPRMRNADVDIDEERPQESQLREGEVVDKSPMDVQRAENDMNATMIQVSNPAARQSKENYEFLLNLGFYGSLVSVVHLLLFDRAETLAFFRALVKNDASQTDLLTSVLAYLGLMYGLYIIVSVFLSSHDAALLNLSMLTANLWGLVFTYIEKQTSDGSKMWDTVSLIYWLGYVFVITGIFLYSWFEKASALEQPETRSFAQRNHSSIEYEASADVSDH